MKKIISALLCFLLVISTLTLCIGCGDTLADSEKISIVCTLFPQYDWVRNIVGNSDNIEVSLLIQNGADPHSYQPTASDIMKISNCDMIVFVCGESDTWVSEALERAQNRNIKQIALSELEGMTLQDISSSSHTHSHDEHEHGSEHPHSVFDEHLWLSLKNAITATERLTVEICALDKDNEKAYSNNAESYIASLHLLDSQYRLAIEQVAPENRFMIFADRFPFVYLLSDYSIDYQAAFDGCTAEADADFDTVIKLINEADAHCVSYIAVTESSDQALAKTVAASASKHDIKILTMNSLQNVSQKNIENGASYLEAMRENLSAIKFALSE